MSLSSSVPSRSSVALSWLIGLTACSMTPTLRPQLPLPHPGITPLVDELSRDSTYLKLNGWSLGKPLDLAPVIEKKRLKLGLERSPQVDLKLILSALLEPIARDEIDESVWCQHFTLIRLLRREASARSISLPPSPRCPAFERWMRADELEGVEVMMATPNASTPVSSFGHTMIRLRYAKGQRINHEDLVYELVALVSPHISGVSYMMRGVMGGYSLIFEPRLLREISRANRSTQHRDLIRYDLKLSESALRAVLQRLWEVERRAYLPYYFLNKNCSSYLYWFIETALFDQIELPKYEKLLAPPSDVIDVLSTPLLSRDPPPLKAYYKEVQMWRREQRRLWETLARFSLSSLDETFASTESLDELAEVLLSEPEEVRDAGTMLIYLELKVRKRKAQFLEQELKLITQHRVIREHLDEVPTVKEMIRLRREYYRDEDLARRKHLSHRLRKKTEALMNAPDESKGRSPLSQAKARLKDAKRSFLEISSSYAKWRGRLKGGDIRARWRRLGQTDEPHTSEQSWDVHSGFRYMSISTHFALDHTVSPVFTIQRALWRERQGSHRDYGIGPTRGLSLLDSALSIQWNTPFPKALGFMSKLFEVTTFARTLSADSVFSFDSSERLVLPGWSASVNFFGARGAQSLSLDLGGGVLAPDPNHNRWQAHLMLHFTPRVSNSPNVITTPTVIATPTVINQPQLYGLPLRFADESDPLIFGSSSSLRASISYRLGNTGRLSLSGRYERDINHGAQWSHRHALQTALALEAPLSTNEELRLNASVSTLCVERCGHSFSVGLGW